MIFLKLILTNLGRHRIRTLISVAGIAFSVAAMLTVVTILQGAVGMFSGLLSKDSQMIVFEKNVSRWSFIAWQAGTAVYIAVMFIAGWIEGGEPAFTMMPNTTRTVLYGIRLACGIAMMAASWEWLWQLTRRVRSVQVRSSAAPQSYLLPESPARWAGSR